MKYIWDIEKIKKIVPNCINLTEVLNELKIPRQGNNSKTLRNLLDNNKINYSHFTGRSRKYNIKKININEYLSNFKFIRSSSLKLKLYKEGLKNNKCESCGISTWLNKNIVCQLHHIDGNPNNNNINNLQILCPNCHSLTDNYCGSANKKFEKLNHCLICNISIKKTSIHCSKCSHERNRKINRPSKEELLLKWKELKSMTSVGKFYGVSDNAVKKWFISYKISPYKKDLLIITSKI